MRLVTTTTDLLGGTTPIEPEIHLNKTEVATLKRAARILAEMSKRMEAEVGIEMWQDGDADTLDVQITRYALDDIIHEQEGPQ